MIDAYHLQLPTSESTFERAECTREAVQRRSSLALPERSMAERPREDEAEASKIGDCPITH